MARHRPRPAVGVVVALAVAAAGFAACGAPIGPVVAATASPTASGAGRSLTPSAYAIEAMKPSFSITLPEGFILQQLTADQFFISRGADPAGSGLAIVRLAGGGLIERLDPSPEFAQKSRVIVQLGSLVGPSIAMDVAPGRAQPPVVLESAELHTPFVLPLGATGRVIEFTIASTPVAIFYFAPAADFATYEPFIQGVLTSLTFRT